METKDPNAAGHSDRIARLAEWMAEPLSMGAQDVQALRYAAMLHDVGKVGVPTRILRRPRALTPADLESLTHHPALGSPWSATSSSSTAPSTASGTTTSGGTALGYPDGLAGDEIPLISRVIAVADAFDALTTDRAERPGLRPPQALKQIEQRRGRQFDPHVVAALATVLERHDWPITSADEDGWSGCGAISTTTTRSPGSRSGPPRRRCDRAVTAPTPHPVADEPSPRTRPPA